MKKKHAKHVRAIRKVRERNNVLWMTILEIALHSAPAKTKGVLKKIRRNDNEISGLVGALSK